MNKIYFTADLHFGHTNILKHCSERPFVADGLIKEHDQWLLDLWLSTDSRKIRKPPITSSNTAQ